MSKDILNEKTEETVKRIHLLVTNLCSRNCPNCCNKCYPLSDIPVIAKDELENCETLFLTGGEPFEFCNPNALAKHYKEHYPNIKDVIVYGNVLEFFNYLRRGGKLNYIDGISLSIKSASDLRIWNEFLCFMVYDQNFFNVSKNRLYCFIDGDVNTMEKFPVISRDWVDYKEWKPNLDSIFRKAF